MADRTEMTRALISLGAALIAASPSPAEKPPSPFVRLFDTQAASSAPLSAEAVAKRTRWAAVPENDLTHKFAGDAAFLNDKLAVVLRRRGAGAEVYSRTPAGWKPRSLLAPGAAPGDAAGAFSSLRIAENTPAAVMLEATYETRAGKPVTGRFRLTTGMAIVEFRAGKGTDRLRLRDRIRHVVVPELFANDFIVSPDRVKPDRVGIPAENTLLALLGRGEGIGVCVWRSVEQNADAILAGTGEQRAIRACEIECDANQSVWYGLLEAEGIWHERIFRSNDLDKDFPLKWRPPFGAKWRCNFTSAQGWLVSSSEFADTRRPAARACGSSSPECGCWFDSGRAYVFLGNAKALSGPEAVLRPRLLVYPIDRSPATQLTVFCPTDVMRNAVGVGPCQYVLDMVGLGSDVPAAPVEVARWLQRLFKRKREQRQAEAIKERLRMMTRHVRGMNARIDEYVASARRLAELCRQREESETEGVSNAARELGRILSAAVETIHRLRDTQGGPELEERLPGEILALVGKPDAVAKLAPLAEQLRRLGEVQDRRLAEARMAFRRLKQRCRMLPARCPQAAGFAAEVRAEVEKMLRKRQADG